LTIGDGDVAKASGTKVETIRFYQRSGLIPAPARTKGNYRAYVPEHLDRLRFVRLGGDTSSFTEGRIAFLKAELAITDAQKAVWETYAAALKKNLQGMQAMRESMTKVMQAKTPVERLDAHIAAMDERLASLKEVKPGLAALYAALSVEQRKKADQILTGMGCMM
jgi:DNA-binding transcriptional MerR regulator